MNQDERVKARLSQPPRPGDEKLLRIENETVYRKTDLRRFFLAGLDAMRVSARRTVRVKYARGKWIKGRAWIDARDLTMRITLPKHGPVDVRLFAQVFEHEVEHNLGLLHRGMCNSYAKPVPWADGLEIRTNPERAVKAPLTSVERMQERERRALAGVAKWERKAKLAKTKLAAWKRKVRYYERKRAAVPPADANVRAGEAS